MSAHLGAAGLFLPIAGTTPRVCSTWRAHVQAPFGQPHTIKHHLNGDIIHMIYDIELTACPQTSCFSCKRKSRPSTTLQYINTQVCADTACRQFCWVPAFVGPGVTFRMRLLTALEPCTSLLGGMWSPTTLPMRCPQWWHPSLLHKDQSTGIQPRQPPVPIQYRPLPSIWCA